MRNFVAKSLAPTGSEIAKVTVFDPENKFVAHSGTFEQAEKRDQVVVWKTLFEPYLCNPPSSSASPNSKVLALLHNTDAPL